MAVHLLDSIAVDFFGAPGLPMSFRKECVLRSMFSEESKDRKAMWERAEDIIRVFNPGTLLAVLGRLRLVHVCLIRRNIIDLLANIIISIIPSPFLISIFIIFMLSKLLIVQQFLRSVTSSIILKIFGVFLSTATSHNHRCSSVTSLRLDVKVLSLGRELIILAGC